MTCFIDNLEFKQDGEPVLFEGVSPKKDPFGGNSSRPKILLILLMEHEGEFYLGLLSTRFVDEVSVLFMSIFQLVFKPGTKNVVDYKLKSNRELFKESPLGFNTDFIVTVNQLHGIIELQPYYETVRTYSQDQLARCRNSFFF